MIYLTVVRQHLSTNRGNWGTRF